MFVAAGPEVTMATPGRPGDVGVALGHVPGALLVAHEDVAERAVEQRVVHRQDAAAGQAEDHLDALELEGSDEGLAAVQSHRPASLSLGVSGSENDDDLPAGRSLGARAVGGPLRAQRDYEDLRGGGSRREIR